MSLALVAGLLVLVAGCTASGSDNPAGVQVRRSADPSGFRGAALAEPYTMPDQSFTDTSGQAYNLRTTSSRPVTLLFFGYTHCPDVCTGVMSDVATALSRMDPSARERIQVVFVTTDPARDNEKTIRAYLDRFDPDFVGLTGDLPAIKTVAGRVGVDIEGMKKLPSGGYEVGHSAQVLGFGKDHKARVLWTPSTAVGDLMHDFDLLVAKQQ
nr:SCO family protein [Microlunatus panaciterrae]